MGVYKNRLGEAILIHIHNIRFYGEISKFFILIPTPDFPHFYYMLGGNLGSLLYGDVSVMRRQEILEFQNSIFIIIASLAIKHI